jgi:hypothetical protein
MLIATEPYHYPRYPEADIDFSLAQASCFVDQSYETSPEQPFPFDLPLLRLLLLGVHDPP